MVQTDWRYELRCGTQRTLFGRIICMRPCPVLHLPTHCRALVFQLTDLKREENGAQVGEVRRATQLCQPRFQGDLTLWDNHVYVSRNGFHYLELNHG